MPIFGLGTLTYGMRNINKETNQLGIELYISNYSIKEVVTKQYYFFSSEKSILNIDKQLIGYCKLIKWEINIRFLGPLKYFSN